MHSTRLGKPASAHGEEHEGQPGVGLQQGKDLEIVGGFAGRGDDLIRRGGHFQHAAHDRIERRRALEVVIGDDELRIAKQLQFRLGALGAFDFQIDSLGAGGDGGGENPQLLLNAAVEAAAVLMAPASGQDGRVGVQTEKLADDRNALLGRGQVIETEFEEPLALSGLAPRLFEEPLRLGEAEGNADARENRASRHAKLQFTKEYHAEAGAPSCTGAEAARRAFQASRISLVLVAPKRSQPRA